MGAHEEHTEPVDDLSIVVLPGRVQSSAPALDDAVEAERLGFHRLWHSERYSPKEAGALFGAIAARTSRISMATCAINPLSRTPMATAGMFATLQSMFGPRFALGLGRGDPNWTPLDGVKFATDRELLDNAHMISALWRGESVHYEGPWGTFPDVTMIDRPADPPGIWCITLAGGPKACRAAADPVFEGAMTSWGLTPEAVHTAVERLRQECERVGRDPAAFRTCASVVIAPDLSDDETAELVHVRLMAFLALQQSGEILVKTNRWEDSPAVSRIRAAAAAQFGAAKKTMDQSFTRQELIKHARQLVPDDVARQAFGFGSSDECLKKLLEYRAAGATEIAIYGPKPAQCAAVIEGWRAAVSAPTS